VRQPGTRMPAMSTTVGAVRRVLVALAVLPMLATAHVAAGDRVVLAIGAHAGDAEITTGALLARHRRLGDRVAMLHLTLGEGGNPKVSPAAYGEQKKREALAAAKVLGADVFFGPWKDGELRDTEDAARYVADVIRQVKPTHVVTHWKSSLHPDHGATFRIVNAALLLASLEGFESAHPRHRGVRGVYYAENWEDAEGFTPYLLVDVAEDLATWKAAATSYEFVRGGISSFPYLEYYEALARVRGAMAGKRFAVALDVDPFAKKRVLDALP
jgi:LmbE family N-acetylglucosaminyl deacetylase